MTGTDDLRTALSRHANELPERLEAAIGTGWVDRDEDPPDYDTLLADAAATIRQLAPLAAQLAAARTALTDLLNTTAAGLDNHKAIAARQRARAWLAGTTEPAVEVWPSPSVPVEDQ